MAAMQWWCMCVYIHIIYIYVHMHNMYMYINIFGSILFMFIIFPGAKQKKKKKYKQVTFVSDFTACPKENGFYFVNGNCLRVLWRKAFWADASFKNDHLTQCGNWLREGQVKEEKQEDRCYYGSLNKKGLKDVVWVPRTSYILL